MDLQLRGKTALVTGSTAGIGFAIAESLAKEGARVIVNGRTEARVAAAVAKIQGDVVGLAADLGTRIGVAAAIERFPGVEILINNLGIFEPKAFEEISDDEWFRVFEVNVMSGVRLSRHYLPRMKSAGWGRIIFISSESAVQIPSEMIHYGMTKTAQVAVARGMAETAVGTGVTVNSVLAGPTASEGVGGFLEKMARDRGVPAEVFAKEFLQAARPTSLLGRFETPEEVAHLVTFVASPLSVATNGAALRADGGVIRAVF